MRKGTLTVKLKFKVLPDGLSGQSVAGEPVFPASIAQGNTFEVDISPICDTRKAEVKYGLVSSSLESVTDTAKVYIPASMDAYNVAFKRKLVQSIIYCATERERVWATIDYGDTRLFTGIVDLSNLTIQSYSYQGDIELVLKDNGYLLDEKIAQSIELPVQAFPRFNSASSPKTKGVYYKDPDNANAFYFWNGSAWAHKESFSDTESKYFHPDATVRVWSSAVVGGELAESVVGVLLGMAGYSVSGGTIDPSASDTSTSVVRCFTYDMSEDKTYKEVLDTLLKEYRMCLTFTPEGKVRIVSLSHTSIHATRDIGYGLKGTLGRRGGIKTTFEASKEDGVKLKYSSGLAVRREQSIYSENLGSEFDENGELKGTAIKPQQCLPETGDITATYQEFNAKFLDRAYTTKVNRKENEDLSIISTHGHHLEVAQKGGTLTYPAFTVGESAEHGTGANPYFMPKKAQVLFRNDYEMKNKDPDSTEYEEEAESHSIYLQIFNIVADVLYRDKTTTIYAPSATANPETYESTYLFDDGPARTFANFYLGWNQYGAMKTDWTEYKGTVDTIGSIIGYQHTDSAISSYCLLSEETISFTGSPDVPFVIKMHGIGIAPYNDKPVQSVSYMGDNKNRGANGATGPQGEKGEAGATGTSVTGIVEEYALSTSSTSVTGTWGTAVPTLTPTNRYLWNRSKTQYSNGTASGYTTPVVIGVYGDKGDTGGTGATGRGISSITEYYLASASPTAPSASDTGWSTSAQTPTEAKPYLWNKTVVTYTSGSPTTTIAMIGQSIKGNPGATGATGNGIKSVTVTYGVSSSASTQPTSWSSTIPAVAENQFLWTRTITDYTSDAVADTVTYTYAKQGKSGSAGTSVTVSSIQYQAGTSATTAPTGTWSNNPVSVAQGQYLWTKTTFSDGKVAYGVARQGTDGNPGATGATGRGISSIAHYYATTTTQSAPSASSITSTTIPAMSASKKYLWRKTVITYTDSTTSHSVELIAVYGDTGDSASIKDFDLDLSAKAFSVSPRGYTRTAQTIAATCTLIHVAVSAVTITWSSTSSQVTLTPSSDKTTCTIKVAARVALLPFRVSCAVTGVGLTKTVSVDVQPESGNAYSPIYLGTNWDTTNAYTPDNDPIWSGDYYLDTSTNTPMIATVAANGTITYSAMQTGNPNTALIMGTVLSDILAQGSGVQSTCVAVNAYFGAIAAKSGFIESLRSQVIQSMNYEEDASGQPTSGYKLDGPNNVIKAANMRAVGGRYRDINIDGGQISISNADGVVFSTNSTEGMNTEITATGIKDAWLVSDFAGSLTANAETASSWSYNGEPGDAYYLNAGDDAYKARHKESTLTNLTLNSSNGSYYYRYAIPNIGDYISLTFSCSETCYLSMRNKNGSTSGSPTYTIGAGGGSGIDVVGMLGYGSLIELRADGWREFVLTSKTGKSIEVTAFTCYYAYYVTDYECPPETLMLLQSKTQKHAFSLNAYKLKTQKLAIGSKSSDSYISYTSITSLLALLVDHRGNFTCYQGSGAVNTYTDGTPRSIGGTGDKILTVSIDSNSITITHQDGILVLGAGDFVKGAPALRFIPKKNDPGATVLNLNASTDSSKIGSNTNAFASTWTQNINNVPVTDSNNQSLAISGAGSIVGAINQINRDLTKKASFTFKHQIIRNWSGGTGGSEVTYDCVANNYLPNDTSRQYVVIGEMSGYDKNGHRANIQSDIMRTATGIHSNSSGDYPNPNGCYSQSGNDSHRQFGITFIMPVDRYIYYTSWTTYLMITLFGYFVF